MPRHNAISSVIIFVIFMFFNTAKGSGSPKTTFIGIITDEGKKSELLSYTRSLIDEIIRHGLFKLISNE
jgi:hypothetical protein